MNDLRGLLRDNLSDWRTGWSMGTFGAIAEFHQDADEVAVIDDAVALARATKRGGICLDRAAHDALQPVAYETLSPKRHRWSQAIALCLPEKAARRSARSVLTELGPDDHAVRGVDRTGILFDMGLALPQCDFCIRTSDPKLLGELRAALGRSLFEHGNPAMMAILAGHPHRVALTNIGRVEVYQKIGGPDTGDVSPPGPHTHLLPKLLRTGRTHSANTPIPEGLLPLGSMHPGNPVIGPMGENLDYDDDLHQSFQALLGRYGDPDIVALKSRVVEALESGVGPDGIEAPRGRFARAALRLALRQQARRAEHFQDGAMLASILEWQKVHDATAEAENEEEDAPGH